MVEFSHAIISVSDMASIYCLLLGFSSACESRSSFLNGRSSRRREVHWPCTLRMVQQFRCKAWLQQARCQLGFSIENIEAFHQEMIAKGVTCLQSPEKEELGGKMSRVCRSRWATVLGG